MSTVMQNESNLSMVLCECINCACILDCEQNFSDALPSSLQGTKKLVVLEYNYLSFLRGG